MSTNAILRSQLKARLNSVRSLLRNKLSKESSRLPWIRGLENALRSRYYAESIMDDLIEWSPYIVGKKVLDFGCGSGVITHMMGAVANSVCGLDYEGDYKHHLQHERGMVMGWIAELGCQRSVLETYAGQHLPYKDNRFDSVVMYGVIEHLDEPILTQVMGEIKRVMRPNAKLLISKLPRRLSWQEMLWRSHDKRYFRLKLVHLLSDIGFLIYNLPWTRDRIHPHPKPGTRSHRTRKANDRLGNTTKAEDGVSIYENQRLTGGIPTTGIRPISRKGGAIRTSAAQQGGRYGRKGVAIPLRVGTGPSAYSFPASIN